MSEVSNLASSMDLANKAAEVRRFTRKLMSDESTYEHAKRHILRVSERKVRSLVDRYAEDPVKSRKHLVPLMEDYMSDVMTFLNETANIFRELDSIVIAIEREEYDDLKRVEELLNQWIKARHVSIFTPSIITDFRKAFYSFESFMMVIIRKDVTDDRRMLRKKRPLVGFFTRIRPEIGLVRQIRRLAKKVSSEEKKEREIITSLEHELQNGSDISYPYRFARLLKQVGILEEVLARIRDDVRQLIVDYHADTHKVIENSLSIVGYFQGFLEFRRYDSQIKDLSRKEGDTTKASFRFASLDYRDQISMHRELKRNDSLFKYLVVRFIALSKNK